MLSRALSSGNPLLMEEAKAAAELSRLVRLAPAHDQAQNMLKHRISQTPNSSQPCNEIPHLAAAIAKRTDTRGDQFLTQIGNQLHNDSTRTRLV